MLAFIEGLPMLGPILILGYGKTSSCAGMYSPIRLTYICPKLFSTLLGKKPGQYVIP